MQTAVTGASTEVHASGRGLSLRVTSGGSRVHLVSFPSSHKHSWLGKGVWRFVSESGHLLSANRGNVDVPV